MDLCYGKMIIMKRTTTMYPKGIKAPASKTHVLKPGSNNAKLGFILKAKSHKGKRMYSVTLTERATCPTSCQHWDDCYGNNMPFAHRFDTIGLMEKIESDISILLKKHKEGIMVRLHVLGDFYSTEYVAFWERMLLENPKLAVFGFTAREDKIGRAVSILNIRFSDRCVIRTSRNKESNGIDNIFAASESFEGKAFTCPEQTGKVKSCADCGLCWTATKTVRFLSH